MGSEFPLGLPISNRVFRADRLVSSRYWVDFGISSVLLVPLTIAIIYIGDPSGMVAWKRIPLGSLYLVGLVSVAFLWLGMWLSCGPSRRIPTDR